ncbi:MAG TPA: phosphate signaling complex protein PhoU [Candidatus Anaerotruncus excrementipullorum]|uniref:Phosphate-specific transport system accessory protein PhoU n=1 Tax=Candidatus Anaerotruncus excrementipullorum TaxID=2838465 RepID=A0A9D2B781_9FIRM|nr:phosphate signaling complex protein PhoU [Candidatus Anaerotruncus excrementipullorum]
MRARFDKELELLNNELMEMGGLIERAIRDAVNALLQRDAALAQQVITCGPEVDEKEKQIERRCLRLLLQQQPVAADLRLVSTALKMITDMERIGDQAEDIGEIVIRLSNEPVNLSMDHISQMAWATIKMVTGAIDAFVARNLDRARAVIACDDIVDDLFVQVRNDLVAMIRDNTANGEQAIDLIMVAKYFERIGDHATNIAEWVVFAITGEHNNQQVL